MWCVYVSLCRGVLNTPYKRPSEGGARALPLVVYRHSPSMGWRFVGRMPYAPTLTAEK